MTYTVLTIFLFFLDIMHIMVYRNKKESRL